MTEQYQHKARKRFGQNFLHDAGVIDRILRSIHAKTEDRLLEIGPGQGALTQGLLSSGAQLDVVELDKDLGKSKSGKTRIVATTGGGGRVPGTEVTVNLNVYK